MRIVRKSISVELCSWEETTQSFRDLLFSAARVRNGAQPPYSKYRVGCAIRSAQGLTYIGANVENVAYTPTMHAEWMAVSEMAVQEAIAKKEGRLPHPDLPIRKIVAVAVVAAPAKELVEFPPKPWKKGTYPEDPFQWSIAPCGLCRQVIWENCMNNSNVMLIECTPSGEVAMTTMGDAYPFPFGPGDLGIDISRA